MDTKRGFWTIPTRDGHKDLKPIMKRIIPGISITFASILSMGSSEMGGSFLGHLPGNLFFVFVITFMVCVG